jgi:drug/metabolite transporter (DMT)-like permease
MDVGVQAGLLLSLATAFAAIVGFLYKQRGAVESPPIDWRRPVWSTFMLFRSRAYVLGILIAMGGWGLHVAALALAPISLVQTIIAGGLVFLTVAADRFFGLSVTRREWIGVALTALGLAFLAATFETGDGGSHSDHDNATLAAFVVGCTAIALVLAVLARRAPRPGMMFAVSAGLLWGGSDVSIKAASDYLGDDGLLVLLNPLALVILVLSLVGLLVSASSLQIGPAVPVIAATSVAANVSTIASGPIVFGDPMPGDPLGVALRLLAFALVVFAAALTPGPVRVREATS